MKMYNEIMGKADVKQTCTGNEDALMEQRKKWEGKLKLMLVK